MDNLEKDTKEVIDSLQLESRGYMGFELAARNVIASAATFQRHFEDSDVFVLVKSHRRARSGSPEVRPAIAKVLYGETILTRMRDEPRRRNLVERCLLEALKTRKESLEEVTVPTTNTTVVPPSTSPSLSALSAVDVSAAIEAHIALASPHTHIAPSGLHKRLYSRTLPQLRSVYEGMITGLLPDGKAVSKTNYEAITPLWMNEGFVIREVATNAELYKTGPKVLPPKKTISKEDIVGIIIAWLWEEKESRAFILDLLRVVGLDIDLDGFQSALDAELFRAVSTWKINNIANASWNDVVIRDDRCRDGYEKDLRTVVTNFESPLVRQSLAVLNNVVPLDLAKNSGIGPAGGSCAHTSVVGNPTKSVPVVVQQEIPGMSASPAVSRPKSDGKYDLQLPEWCATMRGEKGVPLNTDFVYFTLVHVSRTDRDIYVVPPSLFTHIQQYVEEGKPMNNVTALLVKPKHDILAEVCAAEVLFIPMCKPEHNALLVLDTSTKGIYVFDSRENEGIFTVEELENVRDWINTVAAFPNVEYFTGWEIVRVGYLALGQDLQAADGRPATSAIITCAHGYLIARHASLSFPPPPGLDMDVLKTELIASYPYEGMDVKLPSLGI